MLIIQEHDLRNPSPKHSSSYRFNIDSLGTSSPRCQVSLNVNIAEDGGLFSVKDGEAMNVEVASYAGIFESIKQRRSIGHMTQQQPTREQIERILEAATYAPNHYVTEPWKFFVLTGAAREQLGRVMAEALEARLTDTSSHRAQAMLAAERRKPFRAPVIIAVTIPGLRHLHGVEVENIEAAAAAVQNMLLTAEEMGLATLWRTGEAAYDPHVKQWFGLAPEDHIVAFVYLGYPAVSRPTRVPTPFGVKTTWLS